MSTNPLEPTPDSVTDPGGGSDTWPTPPGQGGTPAEQEPVDEEEEGE